MTVTVVCSCGKELVVDQAHRGKRAWCPDCRTSVEIPIREEAMASADEVSVASTTDQPDHPDTAEHVEKPADDAPAESPSDRKEEAAESVPVPLVNDLASSPRQPSPALPDDQAPPRRASERSSRESARAPAPDHPDAGEVQEARKIERVPDKKRGGECWKLTCECGKRIHSPLHTDIPIGRCPKCGSRMRLPGYRPGNTQRISKRQAVSDAPASPPAPVTVAKPKPVIPREETPHPEPQSADPAAETRPAVDTTAETQRRDGPPSANEVPAPTTPPKAADDRAGEHDNGEEINKRRTNEEALAIIKQATDEIDQDDVGTIVMDEKVQASLKREIRVGREAALNTADKLRKHHSAERGLLGSKMISAWPLAGKLPRIIAGFIDLTFCTMAAGFVVGLGGLKILPATVMHPAVPITAFITAALLNDCLLQFFGGSIGKRLVVLTLRERTGSSPPLSRAIARGVLKWLLWPGWVISFFDPAERTLHDILCGTLVLKGRRGRL